MEVIKIQTTPASSQLRSGKDLKRQYAKERARVLELVKSYAQRVY